MFTIYFWIYSLNHYCLQSALYENLKITLVSSIRLNVHVTSLHFGLKLPDYCERLQVQARVNFI